MKTEKILEFMGFRHVTGSFFQHPEYGMIDIGESPTPEQLATKLVEMGKFLKVQEIRKTLFINQL